MRNIRNCPLSSLLPWRRTTIDAEAREGVTLTLGDKTGDAATGDAKSGVTEFHILETPGHTQGSVSMWIPSENKLVAGDTLFRDSIGRTDLPGGDGRQILRSIKKQLLPLPDDVIVIPGHGANTTIGREKDRNPFLQNL